MKIGEKRTDTIDIYIHIHTQHVKINRQNGKCKFDFLDQYTPSGIPENFPLGRSGLWKHVFLHGVPATLYEPKCEMSESLGGENDSI
jgi:hypothetical protein